MYHRHRLRLREHGLTLIEAERCEVHEVGDVCGGRLRSHRLADDGTAVGMPDQNDLGVVALDYSLDRGRNVGCVAVQVGRFQDRGAVAGQVDGVGRDAATIELSL